MSGDLRSGHEAHAGGGVANDAATGRARPPAAAIRMPDEVTFGNARAALEQASAGLASAPLVFDLAGCSRFDSSLIAVLLELARRAAAARRRCAFVGAPANLLKLSALYGVDDLLFGEDAGRASAADRPGP